ncbi:MAG: LysM peptidoglycan-binding domain-containing protein [Acidobacteriota bacterium]
MMSRALCLPATIGLAACLGVGCATRTPQVQASVPAQIPDPAPQPALVADPWITLQLAADTLFEEGRRELALGHLSRARDAFNHAIETLLTAPHGMKHDSRFREHFDRMVDRISALELTALAAGDGFREREGEPASIDQLLAISTFDSTIPSAETLAAVRGDLAQTTHDIPIPLNERVLRYVEVFQGRLREFLQDGLARASQYLPMIQSVFRAEGLPLDLAYVPLIESAFKPTALSRASARGVWQFMRGTGLEHGLEQDWFVDERSDPRKATVAAAQYFKSLHTMFNDWHLAMASYNAGPGRVQRAMNRSGRRDFWSLTASSRYLPRETREYVPMILAAVIIAKNPVLYGFDVALPPVRATETVDVPAAVDLRRIAEWAGIASDQIQALNPELRRWTTPIRGEAYTLIVPDGAASLVRDRLAAASPEELNALQWHVVKRGETLTTIARKLRVSRADLAGANYLRTSSRVTVGQRLVIPRMPSAARLAGAADGSIAEPLATTLSEPTPKAEPTTVVHRVRSGETLYSIARRYRTTVDALRAGNKLTGAILKVGTRLIIRSSGESTAQQD